MENTNPPSMPATPCNCLAEPSNRLNTLRELGMDANFAEISLHICPDCGQRWLRYFYEIEAFTRSGRWYLGAITAEQAASLTADGAKVLLEKLPWYFFGGSYFDGKVGKIFGKIF